VFIPVVPLVKEYELTIMGGWEEESSVHQEVLREPLGLESGKWSLCIHKCVVP
jgi:hypothetical protein